MSDNDGAPNAWIDATYKQGDASILFSMSRVDGAYLRGTYGSLATTDYGVSVQFYGSSSLFSVYRVKGAGFAQLLDKKIIFDMKYSYNSKAGEEGTDYDVFLGGLWTAPTDILTDNYSGKRGLGAQFKVVPGFNFGFTLAHFEQTPSVKEYLAQSTVGVKFNANNEDNDKGFAIAGGFTPVDYKFHEAKAYVGTRIPLIDEKLKIFVNAEGKNIGEFGDAGKIDLAEKVSFAPDSRLEAGIILKELSLVNNGAKDSLTGYGELYGQYAIIPNVLLAKVALKAELGLGDNVKDTEKKLTDDGKGYTNLNTIGIEPTIVWSIKGNKVAADLDDIDVGLILGYKLIYWTKAEEVKDNLLMLAFKVAF
ncbi:MAG: hypothetical protein Ta2A_00340 [Treponemataceae bacterium]|nr:MAG: hypothetical protein Ta2A_00340 [Treponemataceae bacterium]